MEVVAQAWDDVLRASTSNCRSSSTIVEAMAVRQTVTDRKTSGNHAHGLLKAQSGCPPDLLITLTQIMNMGLPVLVHDRWPA
jgi:hypothetical protein